MSADGHLVVHFPLPAHALVPSAARVLGALTTLRSAYTPYSRVDNAAGTDPRSSAYDT